MPAIEHARAVDRGAEPRHQFGADPDRARHLRRDRRSPPSRASDSAAGTVTELGVVQERVWMSSISVCRMTAACMPIASASELRAAPACAARGLRWCGCRQRPRSAYRRHAGAGRRVRLAAATSTEAPHDEARAQLANDAHAAAARATQCSTLRTARRDRDHGRGQCAAGLSDRAHRPARNRPRPAPACGCRRSRSSPPSFERQPDAAADAAAQHRMQSEGRKRRSRLGMQLAGQYAGPAARSIASQRRLRAPLRARSAGWRRSRTVSAQ